MKNSFLSALLALGIGLSPGFGLNFMSGSSVDWGHANATENPAKTAEMINSGTQSPTALAQPAPTAPKSKVASADPSAIQIAK